MGPFPFPNTTFQRRGEAVVGRPNSSLLVAGSKRGGEEEAEGGGGGRDVKRSGWFRGGGSH